MTMQIVCELVRGGELEPGDLFSLVGPAYWDHRPPGALGEKLYLRTDTPAPPREAEVLVYRITIVNANKDVSPWRRPPPESIFPAEAITEMRAAVAAGSGHECEEWCDRWGRCALCDRTRDD